MIMASLIGCTINDKHQQKLYIEIFMDENAEGTPQIAVTNEDGNLELQVSDETSTEILELKTALEEINSKETPP